MRPARQRRPEPEAPCGCRRIVLNTGNSVLIDEEDYAYLSSYNWLELSSGGAYRTNGGSKRISMHQDLLHTNEVDHKNGDRFDNRKSNLRAAKHWQNACNAPKRATNKSGYKGVSKDWTTGRWRAELWADKKHIFLGRFDRVEDAALAYDKAARELHGAFACLNFPQPGERKAR